MKLWYVILIASDLPNNSSILFLTTSVGKRGLTDKLTSDGGKYEVYQMVTDLLRSLIILTEIAHLCALSQFLPSMRSEYCVTYHSLL